MKRRRGSYQLTPAANHTDLGGSYGCPKDIKLYQYPPPILVCGLTRVYCPCRKLPDRQLFISGESAVTLSDIVAANLKRVCVEWDISTRDLAQRMGEKSQKSVWNLLNNEHSPRLSTLEPVCRALMVSHQAVVTPNVDTSLLVSRRLPRLIESYNRMTPVQRDNLEEIIAQMLQE